MTIWTNWSGKQRCQPAALRFARSVADIQATVATATASGSTVRVAASGHSHYQLVPTTGTVLDISALIGVTHVDVASGIAEVWAGTPIHALGPALHAHDLALANQGDIDRQQIGGAVSTGTHGTGISLPNLSAAVVGATLVLASGDLVDVGAADETRGTDGTTGTVDSDDHDSDGLWQVARLSLGGVGVITKLRLQLRSAYRLAEHGTVVDYEDARSMLATKPYEHRHFEFFWFPQTDRAVVKTIAETDDDPVYPVGGEGRRRGWSYEVFPSHRPDRHTEMEYSVPIDAGPACFDAVRRLIRQQFPNLEWPLEYRTLAADDIWISTASGQNVATISVHIGVEDDDEPLFRACEEIFLHYGGRPHWGKVHYLDGAELGRRYPRWRHWWAVRDRADPTGTFVNRGLGRLRPE